MPLPLPKTLANHWVDHGPAIARREAAGSVAAEAAPRMAADSFPRWRQNRAAVEALMSSGDEALGGKARLEKIMTLTDPTSGPYRTAETLLKFQRILGDKANVAGYVERPLEGHGDPWGGQAAAWARNQDPVLRPTDAVIARRVANAVLDALPSKLDAETSARLVAAYERLPGLSPETKEAIASYKAALAVDRAHPWRARLLGSEADLRSVFEPQARGNWLVEALQASRKA